MPALTNLTLPSFRVGGFSIIKVGGFSLDEYTRAPTFHRP